MKFQMKDLSLISAFRCKLTIGLCKEEERATGKQRIKTLSDGETHVIKAALAHMTCTKVGDNGFKWQITKEQGTGG